MKLTGNAWKFGDDVNTDEIIPARYLTTSDPVELAKHCMEDADPDFMRKIAKGDIIVAGKNFGCGSSREHAPISIKAAHLSCVIADSFARIFYRNSINIGLPIVESREAALDIAPGDRIEVDLDSGEIFNRTKGKSYKSKPFPPFMQDLISKGGLMNKVRSELQGKEQGRGRG
ncbi:MAG: 3-isopropylmalate dehydratase small subunit [Spirochaetes bacterium]|nr:MAG: 3-isopropylmalate dehydratase small subunit [Spirochaetota bacterium]